MVIQGLVRLNIIYSWKNIFQKNILILYGFYEENDLRDMINFTSSNKEADEKNSVKEFLER